RHLRGSSRGESLVNTYRTIQPLGTRKLFRNYAPTASQSYKKGEQFLTVSNFALDRQQQQCSYRTMFLFFGVSIVLRIRL
ncbi:unnamed protein product, partial [Didymodactylos carnosus]